MSKILIECCGCGKDFDPTDGPTDCCSECNEPLCGGIKMIYYADKLIGNQNWPKVEIEKGKWYAARPENFWGCWAFFCRLKEAWLVLIGKVDCLYWYKQ